MFGIDYFIAGFDPTNETSLNETRLFEVDAYLSEDQDFNSAITKETVESGSEMADHIINYEPIINIEGIFTDTPIELWNPISGFIEPYEGRSVDKILAFLEMRNQKKPFAVSTTLGVWTNVFPTKFRPSKTPEDGYSHRFTATLERFNIQQASYGNLSTIIDETIIKQASPVKDVGATETRKQSILMGLIKG